MIEFEDNSNEILLELKKVSLAGLEAMGMQAESFTKQNTPVDTGRLRNSISHKVAPSEMSVYIGTPVEYAPFVELGTSRQKAQPYLRPAIMENRAVYEQIAKMYLKGEK